MDIRPLPGMTLNELNGLLNDALAPVSERWPGRLTVEELHPPILVMSARRIINWLKWLRNCSAHRPKW